MKRFCLIFFAVFVCFSAAAAGKPIAVSGASPEVNTMAKEILRVEGIKAELFPGKPVPVERFNEFSLVAILESYGKGVKGRWSDAELDTVKRYVHNGGTLLLTSTAPMALGSTGKRPLGKLSELIGFGYLGGYKGSAPLVHFTDEKLVKAAELDQGHFRWSVGCQPEKIARESVEIAALCSPAKGKQFPYLLIRRLGKGRVIYFSSTYARTNRAIPHDRGEADEKGDFILNENGFSARTLRNAYLYFLLSVKPEMIDVKREKVEFKPLGAEGKLIYPPFPEKTAPEKVRSFAGSVPCPLVRGNAPAAVLCAPGFRSNSVNALLKTLSYLTPGKKFVSVKPAALKLSPGKIEVTGKAAGKNAILFANAEQLKALGLSCGAEQFLVKTLPGGVVISGDSGLGLNLMLRMTGFRFLWPGKTGTVIPEVKDGNLDIPGIDCLAPWELFCRQIRPGWSHTSPQAYAKLGLKPGKPHQIAGGELGAWFLLTGMHRQAGYAWGHSFGDYYKRFAKSNPEYFALQTNGLRSQEASPTRPRLCKSNAALAHQAALDRIAKLKKDPSAKSISSGSNDGGYTCFCWCEECRKLDPVNAPGIKIGIITPSHRYKVDYVSLTDRVLTFNNRIAEEVAKEFPDKKLGMYAYSCYALAPVAVAPHPNLLMVFTGGNYSRPGSRRSLLENYWKWASFPNALVWRPNLLSGIPGRAYPQNFGKEIFEDLTFMRQNKLRGCDFDCMSNQWALRGMIYYLIGRAVNNPEHFSYEDILNEYCSAFGAAAPEIKAYWELVAELSRKAAEKGAGMGEVTSDADLDRMETLLTKAANRVQGVEKERVAFLQKGLKVTQLARKFAKAASAARPAARQAYTEYLKELAETAPLSVHPAILAPGKK